MSTRRTVWPWVAGGAALVVGLVARARHAVAAFVARLTPDIPGDVVGRSRAVLPGTSQPLGALLRQFLRPGQKVSALMGLIVNESAAHLYGGVDDVTHGAGFFEAGLGQMPAGRHGTVRAASRTGQGDAATQYKMPGPGVSASAWPPDFWQSTTGVLLRQLGHARAEDWRDPWFQVRALPLMLEQDFADVRHAYPDLFTVPGSDWWTRGELFTFSGGGQALRDALRAQRAALLAAPEGARWEVLRAGGLSPRWMRQVDDYLVDAQRLGYPAA